MKFNLRYGLIATLACLSFSSGLASEFFVSTPEQVETTIALAQPGDTLTMRPGHWTDVKIRFDGDGEAGRPILLRAETPGQVILDGRSSIRIGGSHLVVDGLLFTNGYPRNSSHVVEFRTSDSRKAKFCRLTNSAIINYNPPNINTRYFWVSLYGNNNRVDHCYFSGQNHSGVTLVAWLGNDPNNHQIDHNYFGDRPEGPENGWETIRIGTSSRSGTNSRTIVESNYFYKCDGEIETISNKSNENIYRYNTFVDCNGQLTLRHGKRCVVEGNFFFGNNVEGSSGVRVIDRDHVVVNNYFAGLNGTGFRAALSIMNGRPNSPLNRYFEVINAQILFNTFVDCKQAVDIGVGKDSERTLPPKDVLIANNVVLSPVEQIITYTDSPINISYDSNVMFGGPLGLGEIPPGIDQLDPKLVLEEDGLFRPAQDSPLIDSAADGYASVIEDIEGHARPDSAKDIGADEVSSDTILRRPLTRADVVPGWVDDFITYVDEIETTPPDDFQLYANYPNPFNPSTQIRFDLTAKGHAELAIYNVLGQKTEVLVNEIKQAGQHQLTWNASRLPAGVYFIELRLDGRHVMTRKALLLK